MNTIEKYRVADWIKNNHRENLIKKAESGATELGKIEGSFDRELLCSFGYEVTMGTPRGMPATPALVDIGMFCDSIRTDFGVEGDQCKYVTRFCLPDDELLYMINWIRLIEANVEIRHDKCNEYIAQVVRINEKIKSTNKRIKAHTRLEKQRYKDKNSTHDEVSITIKNYRDMDCSGDLLFEKELWDAWPVQLDILLEGNGYAQVEIIWSASSIVLYEGKEGPATINKEFNSSNIILLN